MLTTNDAEIVLVEAEVTKVLRGRRAAKTLLQPLRLRLLEALSEPNSAAGLACLLEVPRQKINYHLREMEKVGLVEFVENRRAGNCTERIVRASARHYLISPEVLGGLAGGTEGLADKFSSSYLVSVAARTINDVAILRDGARRAGERLATFTLETGARFASPSDLNAFAEELSNAVTRLVAKYHNDKSENSHGFRFALCAHPELTDQERQQLREEQESE